MPYQFQASGPGWPDYQQVGQNAISGLAGLATAQANAQAANAANLSASLQIQSEARKSELDMQKFLLESARQKQLDSDQAAMHLVEMEKMRQDRRLTDISVQKQLLELDKLTKAQNFYDDPKVQEDLAGMRTGRPLATLASWDYARRNGYERYLEAGQKDSFIKLAEGSANANVRVGSEFLPASTIMQWAATGTGEQKAIAAAAFTKDGMSPERIGRLTGLSSADIANGKLREFDVSLTDDVGVDEILQRQDLAELVEATRAKASAVSATEQDKAAANDAARAATKLDAKLASRGIRFDPRTKTAEPIGATPSRRVAYMADIMEDLLDHPTEDYIKRIEEPFIADVIAARADPANKDLGDDDVVARVAPRHPAARAHARAALAELRTLGAELDHVDPYGSPEALARAKPILERTSLALAILAPYSKEVQGGVPIAADFVGQDIAASVYNVLTAAQDNRIAGGPVSVPAWPGAPSIGSMPIKDGVAWLNRERREAAEQDPERKSAKTQSAEKYAEFVEKNILSDAPEFFVLPAGTDINPGPKKVVETKSLSAASDPAAPPAGEIRGVVISMVDPDTGVTNSRSVSGGKVAERLRGFADAVHGPFSGVVHGGLLGIGRSPAKFAPVSKKSDLMYQSFYDDVESTRAIDAMGQYFVTGDRAPLEILQRVAGQNRGGLVSALEGTLGVLDLPGKAVDYSRRLGIYEKLITPFVGEVSPPVAAHMAEESKLLVSAAQMETAGPSQLTALAEAAEWSKSNKSNGSARGLLPADGSVYGPSPAPFVQAMASPAQQARLRDLAISLEAYADPVRKAQLSPEFVAAATSFFSSRSAGSVSEPLELSAYLRTALGEWSQVTRDQVLKDRIAQLKARTEPPIAVSAPGGAPGGL